MVKKTYPWTSPDVVSRDAARRWLSRPAAERVSAVETIREAIGMYAEAPLRLERTYRIKVLSRRRFS